VASTDEISDAEETDSENGEDESAGEEIPPTPLSEQLLVNKQQETNGKKVSYFFNNQFHCLDNDQLEQIHHYYVSISFDLICQFINTSCLISSD
jgi:hypothetical protein